MPGQVGDKEITQRQQLQRLWWVDMIDDIVQQTIYNAYNYQQAFRKISETNKLDPHAMLALGGQVDPKDWQQLENLN